MPAQITLTSRIMGSLSTRWYKSSITSNSVCESSHVTTHDDPVYVEDGVVHYCVGNMPGAVPRTSTIALTNATLRYGLEIAGKGLERAAAENPAVSLGVNTYLGKITNRNVALAHGREYADLKELIG